MADLPKVYRVYKGQRVSRLDGKTMKPHYKGTLSRSATKNGRTSGS